MARYKLYGVCENKSFIETIDKASILRRIVILETGNSPITDFYQYVKTKYSDHATRTSIPYVETYFGTNFKQMFLLCSALTSIPDLDISNGIDFTGMFAGCSALENIPDLDVSKGIIFSGMFSGCIKLTRIPDLDVSNGTDFGGMFYSCTTLTSIPDLDVSNGTNFEDMFRDCRYVTTFRDNPLCKNKAWQFGEDVKIACPLDRTSILKVFNGLKTVNNKTITINAATNRHLTDEDKAIARIKGWTVSVQ